MIVCGELVARWVGEGAKVPWTADCRAVGLQRDGKIVCGVLYNQYTGASITMHARVDDASKVSRAWLFAIFDYPFNQLKVKRVTGLCSSANLKSKRLLEHLGGKYETVLEDYFNDGDGLVYVMRKHDCRWLDFRK